MMRAMAALDFPQHYMSVLQELATRLIDSRKVGTPNEPLARDLLGGFYDLCMRAGLDRLLGELAAAYPPFDTADRTALSDHPTLLPALITQLATMNIDDGGPRNVKPRMLADRVVAALGLTLVDEIVQTSSLGDDVRTAVIAALASAVDTELAVPQIRETIIATARGRCEERYLGAFDRIAAQLDQRGMQMIKQPKVPLDAVQAVQRLLTESRNALVDRLARAAIDRAKDIIGRADADAAARIDSPITLSLTPRDVAILRASDARVPKVPAAFAQSLLDSLTELARLAWRPPERAVRVYSPKETFAVGDLLDHPKFGRGSVITCVAQRIEVEFADGRHTLVHVRPSK
jgi:hypothetical protein